ncbi:MULTISPECIES: hypothetical protein [unclassified Bradyrhizobium]|uniref:hypothetical protein n=1 Tax=unclassified Bradyrhizobium TaxID=2631580 RepID=UPI0028E982C2|nr:MULTISPECIES: hypothetical protein [unclassified Bradyrhizobium]
MVGLTPGGIAVSGDAIALSSVVAGLLLLAFVVGVWASRRPVDVLDLLEGPPDITPDAPGPLIILGCCCSARLPSCFCAVDGFRNPRGAGRGRCRSFRPHH